MFDLGAGHSSLLEGVARVQAPVLVLGVNSDILFPVEQQREMAALLKEAGTCAIYRTQTLNNYVSTLRSLFIRAYKILRFDYPSRNVRVKTHHYYSDFAPIN